MKRCSGTLEPLLLFLLSGLCNKLRVGETDQHSNQLKSIDSDAGALAVRDLPVAAGDDQ